MIPACLAFEITETAAVAHLQQARAFADRMHSCGCGLALDNFGAGLASFFYLKNLPFDYLKIDGEFIRSLSVNPVDRLNSPGHFKFKIGDKVRFKRGETNGVVVSGDCYGPTRVLYVVQFKSPNVIKCTYQQDEIELLPEQ